MRILRRAAAYAIALPVMVFLGTIYLSVIAVCFVGECILWSFNELRAG